MSAWHAMSYRKKNILWNKVRIWNLAFQPLKTLNLYYRNVYGHQDWQKVSHSKGIPHVSKTTFSEENCPPPILKLSLTLTQTLITTGVQLSSGTIVRIPSHIYPFITWSCEITWQIKTIIYPLPQYLWTATKPGRVVTDLEGILPWSHMTL